MLTTLLTFIRTTSFLIMLCVTLATTTISLGIWAVSLTSQVATMSASAAATAIQHRKAIAKAVFRTKTKARLKRLIVAIPAIGAGAAVYMEKQDYDEWQAENPDKTSSDYACEVGAVSAEVVDDLLQDLPEMVRPSPDMVLSKLPECVE